MSSTNFSTHDINHSPDIFAWCCKDDKPKTIQDNYSPNNIMSLKPSVLCKILLESISNTKYTIVYCILTSKIAGIILLSSILQQ